MTNREIAQEISNRIGTAPVPFDSVYSIALEIYHQLGGEESQFDSVYSILLEILPLVEGGGAKQLMQEVTYTELKALRDNSQLVKGQKYCITDYVTTTAQANTQSAGHQFDIIVTADSEDKLNENAKAINHPEITSVIQANVVGDTMYFRRYPEGDDENGYAWGSCNYAEGEHISDVTNWSIEVEEMALLYTETETLSIGDNIEYDGDGGEVTEFSNSVNIDYFANSKLESWELKYCLDNDTNRFSWAQEGQEGFTAIKWGEVGDYSLISRRYPECDDTENGFAWVLVNNTSGLEISEVTDWDDIEIGTYAYTDSETPSEGDIVNGDESMTVMDYQSGIGSTEEGKGVIYYMKDEWNNQVGFDFKNIKIYNEYDDTYDWLFGREETDYSIKGEANNNNVDAIVEGADIYGNFGTLTLPSNSLGYAVVGYDSKYPTIEGLATLIYDNTMNITGISDVTFSVYTESDLLNMNDAKVRISFDMSMGGSSNGTITQSGFLSKFVMSMGGVDVPMLMLTFGFMDMATQTFKTLYMVYDTSLSTPAWSVQLQ